MTGLRPLARGDPSQRSEASRCMVSSRAGADLVSLSLPHLAGDVSRERALRGVESSRRRIVLTVCRRARSARQSGWHAGRGPRTHGPRPSTAPCPDLTAPRRSLLRVGRAARRQPLPGSIPVTSRSRRPARGTADAPRRAPTRAPLACGGFSPPQAFGRGRRVRACGWPRAGATRTGRRGEACAPSPLAHAAPTRSMALGQRA